MGLGLQAMWTALAENSNLAKGELQNPTRRCLITNNDQLQGAKDYRPLIIDYRNGNPVR
jgi:multidrug efflux pump